MGETEVERITRLECKTDNLQKQTDENTEEIKTLKDFTYVVDSLTSTVNKQGENIDRLGDGTNKAIQELTNIISRMKETTEEMKLCQARIETKQQYYWVDGIVGLCKKIGWKGAVAIVGGGGAVLAYLNSVLHIFG